MLRLQTITIALVCALLLMMAAVIIGGLNDESLWGDEGWSLRFTDGESPRAVTLAIAEDRHPPLYFLGLWAWRQVAGDDEIALRYLGVFASMLTGALLFRLGQHLFGTGAGLAALLVFALLDKQVTFSQEVRHYPWLLMWTTASFWALVRWQRQSTRGASFFYGATVIGGLYTHSFMFIILLIHAFYAATTIRPARRLRKLVTLWLLAGIAFLPWSLVFINQYLIHGGLRHDFPLTREIFDILVADFLGRPIPLFAGLLLLGILSPFWRKNSPGRGSVLLPIFGLTLPLAIIVGLPQISDEFKLLTDRNLSIIIPSLALLIGLGVTLLKGYARIALVAFLLINGLLTTDANTHNPPWRPISRYVAAHQIDGQPVVLDVGGADAALSYHLRQEADDVPQISILQLRENEHAEPLTVLRFERIGESDGLWYVQWNDDPEFHNAFVAWGFTRSAVAQDAHLGGPIFMHRYDSVAILDEEVAVFDDTLILNRVAMPETVSGDDIVVGLWWRALAEIDADYRVSVFLLDDAGQILTQSEQLAGDGHTSEWTMNTLHFDAHRLIMPDDLTEGDYQLGVRVYSASDETILPSESGDDFFMAGTIRYSSRNSP